ncbi:hypothetical protein [Pyxidicoccus xibeiensis]|uniref:hypothetical protein n=1 Tax=Pyxidicoccus xibeiensis TaxID=2906759 RepID=UPI0020A6DE2A|nr:hypothetical protein [Pyxidicoccus xibeiensis]MCP3139496.1 hypothetical protein [Pyxidicoccus xibeiensis]
MLTVRAVFRPLLGSVGGLRGGSDMRRGWGWSWGACLALVVAACGGPVEEGVEEGPSEVAPLPVAEKPRAPGSARAAAAPGGTRWLQSLGGVGKEHAAGLAHDSEGNVSLAVNVDHAMGDGLGALASYAPGTFVVVKYGTEGGRLWSRHLEGFAESLTVDSRSNVFVTGRNPAGADYGGGPLPAGRFLLKLDRDGDFVWARSLESLGVSSAFEVQRMDTDRFGNVALVGTLPDALLRNVAALLKLGPDGDFLWLHADGREGFATGVAADSEGYFYVTGWHPVRQPGEVDSVPFLMKLDAAGNVAWTQSFDSEYGMATSVAVHGNRVLVSGWFIKPLIFQGRMYQAKGSWSDAFVAAFDREGSARWVRVLGFSGLDVSMDYEDGVTVLGRYEDGDDLGTGPMAGVPGVQSNLFVAKLDRVDGTLRWVRGFPMAHPAGTDVSADRFFVSSHATTGACSVAGGRIAPADFGMGMLPPPMGGRRDLFLGGFDP